jgi:hypothetical protein
MPRRDTQIVQTTGDLHHLIRNARGGKPQDIFDNPTAFDTRNHVFHHDAHRREKPIQEAVTRAQLLAFGLFLGWVVSTRAGS